MQWPTWMSFRVLLSLLSSTSKTKQAGDRPKKDRERERERRERGRGRERKVQGKIKFLIKISCHSDHFVS